MIHPVPAGSKTTYQDKIVNLTMDEKIIEGLRATVAIQVALFELRERVIDAPIAINGLANAMLELNRLFPIRP